MHLPSTQLAPASNPLTQQTSGAVLLEVILALVLFVASAAVITTALRASIDSAERIRLGVHADNLVATVAAEIEMGRRSPSIIGPAPFDPPFTNWTWQLIPPAVDNLVAPFEIIVRHSESDLVRRLAQVLQPPRQFFQSEEIIPFGEPSLQP
jgi:hypothetical protein